MCHFPCIEQQTLEREDTTKKTFYLATVIYRNKLLSKVLLSRQIKQRIFKSKTFIKHESKSEYCMIHIHVVRYKESHKAMALCMNIVAYH